MSDDRPDHPTDDLVPTPTGDAGGEPDAGGERPVGRPVAEALGLTPASEVGRAALNRARAAALARGAYPGRPARRAVAGERARAGRPGAAGDGRDPVLLGDTLARLAAERGWRDELSVGGVIGRWREVGGAPHSPHNNPR